MGYDIEDLRGGSHACAHTELPMGLLSFLLVDHSSRSKQVILSFRAVSFHLQSLICLMMALAISTKIVGRYAKFGVYFMMSSMFI